MIPRLTLVAPAPPNQPKFLSDAAERSARLLVRPKHWRELHGLGAATLPEKQLRRLEPRRPPRLQALELVFQAVCKRTDIVSFRVGVPRRDGSVSPPGLDGLMADTGLSRPRLRRALRDGRRAGYWTFSQRLLEYTAADGAPAYCACRAVYAVTRLFFRRLGFSDTRIDRERREAVRRARGRRERIHPGPLLRARDELAALKGRRKMPPRQPPAAPSPATELAETATRERNALLLALRRKHPDWPADAIRAEADRLLWPPRPPPRA